MATILLKENVNFRLQYGVSAGLIRDALKIKNHRCRALLGKDPSFNLLFKNIR